MVASSVGHVEGLRGLTGHQVVGVLRERYADEARACAARLEAVWETVLCADADSIERMPEPDEWSSDEVRAALGLTRAAANRMAGDAHELFHRLPELGAAMAAGRLDLPRARVIADWTTELSAEHAHQVVAEVLPQCRLEEETVLTTGQLTAEISARAIALDPEWARRRYERSFHHRKVIGSRTPDGTATLSGTNLPLERVAAAVARLDDLAKTAKRAGDPRPIDHLRADLFLAMTDGTYAGLDDDQILQALLASRPEDATSASAADDGDHAVARARTCAGAGTGVGVGRGAPQGPAEHAARARPLPGPDRRVGRGPRRTRPHPGRPARRRAVALHLRLPHRAPRANRADHRPPDRSAHARGVLRSSHRDPRPDRAPTPPAAPPLRERPDR